MFYLLYFRFNSKHTIPQFKEILTLTRSRIEEPRNIHMRFTPEEQAARLPCSCVLSTRNRLLLAFIWLAHYPTYMSLGSQFGVDASFVSMDLHHVISAIIDTMKNEIQWPSATERHTLHNTFIWFPDAIGAVDGTTHRRWRPGARQRAFYRLFILY